MKKRRSWFGYSQASVEHYVSLLETEHMLIEQHLDTKRQQFAEDLQPSRRSLERVKQELQQLERLENRLTDWISLHENR
jgi:hypothetical protein